MLVLLLYLLLQHTGYSSKWSTNTTGGPLFLKMMYDTVCLKLGDQSKKV